MLNSREEQARLDGRRSALRIPEESSMQRVELFSTTNLPPLDRLPFWNEIAMATVGPVVVQPLDPKTFNASVTRVRLADMDLIMPVSGPARVRNVHRSLESNFLNLGIQHTGRSWLSTCGQSHVREVGDFVLFDTARPFEMQFDEMTRVIIVKLPMKLANERIPGLSDLIGVGMCGRTSGSSLLSSFVRNAWTQIEDDNAEDCGQSISDVIWLLLDLAYQRYREPATVNGRRKVLRARAVAFIDTNLADSNLDVSAVASELHVSTRYVQLMFAELLTTPSAFIQARRLEAAAKLLRARGVAASVTEVAFDVGFGDLSGFCTAFRRRFAVTPREFRAGLRQSSS
jgi:AraC family transcriptional regulator, positive regulator of tynA and feaB